MSAPRRSPLAALAGAALLILACAGIWSAWVRGMAPDPAIEGRARPEEARVTRTVSSEAEGIQVSGLVHTQDGRPVAGVAVWGTRAEVVRSDAEGHFFLELPGPGKVGVQGAASSPHLETVERPRDDLDFLVAAHCPLRVEVVDSSGQPVPQAQLELRSFSPPLFPYPGQSRAQTDEGGVYEPAYHPCGSLTLGVQKAPYGAVTRKLELREATTVEVVLERGVRVHGELRDQLGELIGQGRVTAERQIDASVNERGEYELWLAPGDWELRATGSDMELRSQKVLLRVPEELDELRQDFVLERSHRVEVWCEGLPEQDCSSVFPLMCTTRLSPIGDDCFSQSPVVCFCPLGPAAVRGGGQAVAVEPGDEEVWMDFSQGGGLEATVQQGGEPMACRYGLFRVPDASLDLAAGAPARYGDCAEDGRIAERGLQPGRWVFEIYSSSGRWPQDDLGIADGEVLDLGLIDLDEGGSIEVLVVDGLTGEPAHWEAVLVNQQGRASVNPVGAGGMSSVDGLVEATGLAPGTYEVFLPARPLDRVTVELLEDEHVFVQLETSEAAVLEEQGFALERAEGELVISEVDPAGLAAEAGLESGDVVVGVVVMGVDVLDWMPAKADQVAEWVLRSYAGPGVELVVERDDELLDIGI